MQTRRIRAGGPQRLFQGNELMRFMTMVCMFGVLLMLIVRSRDPNTWTWLVGGTEASRAQGAVGEDEVKSKDSRADKTIKANREVGAGQASPARAGEEKKAGNGASGIGGLGEAPEDVKAQAGGPTDLDPEEVDAIKEQFQAVMDGKLSIAEEEMPAYHRLLRWVENQTVGELRKRAAKDAVFTRFYQSPEEYRGKLYELPMTVHLVRDLEAKYDGTELYDIWGTTEESGQWLYNCVVIDVPKGMPIGRNIYESVTFVGYFFKLQGYLPAGAKPNQAVLRAPLFVGRLIWHPAMMPQPLGSVNWSWGLLVLGGFLAFLTIRWGFLLWRPRRMAYTPTTARARSGVHPVDEWLAGDDSGEAGEETRE
jgi:hypothetical protein